MTDKFLKTADEFNMISRGDSVCAAVSGGADSMCLLHLLFTNKDILGITVAAAHVNHCIRGEEADRDEKYVRDYCASFGIPLHVLKTDIPSAAKRDGISTELCARNKRYEFFATLPYSKIATAHTGSDAVETMLMNLSRGASLHGLCSIPPVRGSIIRPLIRFTRDETERYCRENGISFVTDSTNLTEDCTRNKFRHSVLGLLKNINVSFEQNALRCLSSIRQDEDFLDTVTVEAFEKAYCGSDGSLCAEALADVHPAIAKRVLAYYFSDVLRSDCESRHINAFYDSLESGGALTLPSGVTVVNKNGRIFPIRKKAEFAASPESVSFSAADGFCGVFGNSKFEVYRSDTVPSDIDIKSPYVAVIDADKISERLTVRTRLPGDSISLADRHCTKTLKKLFCENRVPSEMRSRIPVFADGDRVIFVPGAGLSSDCIASKKTKTFLIIKSECDKNDE